MSNGDDKTISQISGQEFHFASDFFHAWPELKKDYNESLVSFGIPYLDAALDGLRMGDLCLIGAWTGAGKTQLCSNLALTNIKDGKNVAFMALEAESREIEMRMAYSQLANIYFEEPKERRPKANMGYSEFRKGELELLEKRYELAWQKRLQGFKNLRTFYKEDPWVTIDDLVKNIIGVAGWADLIIIDHAHYVDILDDSDNRGLKRIATELRRIALQIKTPLVLVSHLRKKERKSNELCPGVDEFHGSSDLTKNATKVITLAPGEALTRTLFETYLRVCKNRLNGEATRFIAKVYYSTLRQRYQPQFQLSRVSRYGENFHALDPKDADTLKIAPRWAFESGGFVSGPS